MNNEPVAIRYDFDGYGYQYMDSGSGSDWQTRVDGELLYTHPVKELTDRIAELENALESIDIYLSDTLSGRAEPDPSTYKQWLIDGVREARNRARAIIRKAQET